MWSAAASTTSTPTTPPWSGVAQEAVRNVLRHAGAEGLAVTVRREDDLLALEVVDDGRGFDPEEARDRTTSGWTGWRA